jgi:hypothetical protein
MNKIKSILSKNVKAITTLGILGAVGAVMAMGVPSPAEAALDMTGVTVDTTDYETIATFLITALVGFWGIKKGLALLNK